MHKRIGLIVTLILMLFTLTACGGPESTYKSAQDLLSKGKYAEAAAKFESIGSYEDASTLTMYCKACALCESNNFEAGLAAFEMLGNFKDCSYRITYYEAREYEHEAGTTNWEYMLEAYDIYQQIPVFLDSADRSAALIENVYNLAIKAGESKEYPDTWDNPLNAFYQLSEYKYKDSDKRITYYQIMFAEQYALEDNDALWLLKVAKRYAELGDYLDCKKRSAAVEKKANEILDDAYKAAATLMRDGKYEEALAAFKEIEMHKDSAAQIEACETAILNGKYEAAIALKRDGKYVEALAAFKEIETHKDSAAQIEACETAILDGKYDTAVALMDAGKYEEAITAFKDIETHKDSAAQIAACENAILDGKYAAAVTLMDAGKYEEAIAAFTEIKTYRDSATQITACETAFLDIKYDAAVALMNNGKYAAAYDALIALKGHKDSADKAVSIKEKSFVEKLAKIEVGDYVFFGVYEQDNNTYNGKEKINWLVLAKENNRLLVISQYALDYKPYNETDMMVAWRNCTLRKWLNNDFLNTAFSNAEQALIPTVSTIIGTQDKVFLLSVEEVNKYFASDNAKQCKPTTYAKEQGVYTSGGSCRWWLRSTGSSHSRAPYVYYDGDVHERGNLSFVYWDEAVRPALWINLEP